MKACAFDYLLPDTLAQALAVLQAHAGAAMPIAGGQSLMPMLAARQLKPRLLVDIGRLPGLAEIDIAPRAVRLGALVRWCDIERSEALAAAHPLLCAGVEHVAHHQVRNRGTVGGSLAHADPAAELPGIAVACDARLTIAGGLASREVGAAEFLATARADRLAAGELIVQLQLPAWPSTRRWAFEEFARRKGHFALAAVALFFDLDASGRAVDPHVSLIGVGPRPCRLRAAEAVIAGRVVDAQVIAAAMATAAASCEAHADTRADADYRRALVSTLAGRALARAAGVPLLEAA